MTLGPSAGRAYERSMIRRFLLALLLVVGLVAVPAGAAPAVPAAESSCAVTWGSLARSAGPGPDSSMLVTDVRTGRHACFDRFVVDVGTGPAVGYRVRYVGHVRAQASGRIIPVPGGARLEIVVNGAAYDQQGHATYGARVGGSLPGVHLAGYRTFRSARYAGSFEAVTGFGLGVRARLPFRVLTLPGRVVVDVAHHW